MPLYEYLCTSCGHRFERIQKFSDTPIKDCPECGGLVEMQLSSPAIQFKGAGWYVNDYAKSGKSDAGKSGKSGESAKSGTEAKTDTAKTDSSSSSKTESAPAKPSTESK